METFLEALVGYVWGLPTVILLVGSGVGFSILLKGIQLKGFWHAIQVIRGKYDDPNDPGELSHFQALCTAISGTVGLGNIAGVAVAIKLGGPGATFWMIIAGLLGMATKYTECTLAVMYRRVDEHGVVHGGPMHYIEQGLGKKFKPLSIMFSTCCILGALGAANMFQVNQVAASLKGSFGIPEMTTGITLAVLTGIVIIGGIRRIGVVASALVPFMGVIYVLGCLAVIFVNFSHVPEAAALILSSAFGGTAAVGGFAGASVRFALQQGIRRAAFSNEAGMGTSAIAHAAARTDEPVTEGVVALLEPFIDTVVICTMTALVIVITGAWTSEYEGVALTSVALDSAIPGFGQYFIPIAVFLFAYSTMISWSYYGERSVDYLFGKRGILPYKIVFCLVAAVSAEWTLTSVLNFSDSAMGLMIIPNLIAIWLLFPKVKQATADYFAKCVTEQS